MASKRTNLSDNQKNLAYLFLALFFLILSGGGIFLFSRLNRADPLLTENVETVLDSETETPALVPTLSFGHQQAPADPGVTESPVVSPQISVKLTQSPTAAITPKPTVTNSPTSEYLSYQNNEDKFKVSYKSFRQLYQDGESSGNRYTFYHTQSNITLHVGKSWSWSHPGRQFGTELTISGQPTFRYDTTNQTIVDVEKDGRRYTIQCVHYNQSEVKAECEQFWQSLELR
jgi:hypothetical protein